MNIIHFVGYSAVHTSDFLFEMTPAPLDQYTPVSYTHLRAHETSV